MRSMITVIAILVATLQTGPPIVDLTEVVPRGRVREPMTSSSSGGGVGGSGLVAHEEESLSISLVSAAPDLTGQQASVIFDVELRNGSTRKLELPVNPNLADFEPDGPNVPYSYTSCYIALRSQEPPEPSFSQGVSLYGSREVADSMKELGPGEALRIRARALVKTAHSGGHAGVLKLPLHVIAVLLLQQHFVAQENGALHQESKQIAPLVVSSNAVNLSTTE